MERSCFTLDLGAIRRNAATLLRAAEGAELWAVVKAEGYGHGAVDVSKAALDGGASPVPAVAPDRDVVVCDLGPPSLATAGTGDVLTGIVGAFLAKGVDPTVAAATAAVAHALAARAAPHARGLVASDVVAAIPSALGTRDSGRPAGGD